MRRAGRLTVWDTTQAPIPIRNGLAGMLGLSENQVRVIAPFIGGGFGPKIMMFYQEEVLHALGGDAAQPPGEVDRGSRRELLWPPRRSAARCTRPRWRFDADGRILGVHDVFLHDTGAYDPYGLTVAINSQCTLLGPYACPTTTPSSQAVFTNKPIVTPYRGAGRQHGVFVMERLLDLAARQLGIDRVEIRRRNFIPPDAFPYNNEIIYQDFAPLVYDSGNYQPVLDKAMEMIGYGIFIEDEQPRLRAEGKKVGIGVVAYVEGTGIGPYEGRAGQVQTSGKVSLVTGIGTQGQGHFTSFAQIVADQLGVDVRDVEVVTGDTDQFYWGAGTFASRGAVVAGNAVNEAARDVRQKVLRPGGRNTWRPPRTIGAGRTARCACAASRSAAIELGELAGQANPLRGAVKPGTEPGLEATNYFGPETRRDRQRRARHDRAKSIPRRCWSKSRSTWWCTTAAR